MNVTLERRLLDATASGASPRDTIHAMLDDGAIESGKQAHATLDKWAGKGLYDYGVTLDLGWLEPGAAFPRGV